MIKRIIKIFSTVMAVLLVLVLLVLTGAHLYLRTDHAQRMIKDRVNQAIPGRIDWERADISIFGGRITLHEAKVSGSEKDRIIDLDLLFLDIGVVELLRGQLVIEARLDTPRVKLVRNREEEINIIRAFVDPSVETEPAPEVIETDEKRALPINVILKSVIISNGFFSFADHAVSPGDRPKEMFFDNINLDIVNANLAEKSGYGSIRMGEGVIHMGDIRIPLARFHFESSMSEGMLKPVSADIQLEGENDGPHLVLKGGATEVFDTPVIDFELNLASELSDIREMFSLDIPLTGAASIEIIATGTPDNPFVRLDAHYDGGNLAGVMLEKIDLSSTMTDLIVTLEHLTTRINGGEADLTGVVSLKNAFEDGLIAMPTDLDAISYNLSLDGKGIDFEKLPWTRDFISGMARSVINIEGTGIFPGTISADIDAEASGRGIALGTILEPIDPEIIIKGRLNDGTAFVEPLSVAIQETILQVSGNYVIFENADNGINAAVTLDSPDMAQFLEPLGIAAASSGKTNLSANIAGPVMQPEITATLNSEDLAYGEIRFGNALLRAGLDQSGLVSIERLHIDNHGSQVEIKGHLDLFENGFAGFRSEIPVDLSAKLQQIELSDFYTQIELDGKINGQVRLFERITTPAADISLRGAGLAFGETRIGDITAEMNLLQGTITIEDLHLENQRSDLRLAGRADILAPGTLSVLPDPVLDLTFPESTIYLDDFVDAAAGRITIGGRADGTLTQLAADLSVTGTDLEAAGQTIGQLFAQVIFEGGRLTLAPLELVNKRSHLAVTGGISLFEPQTLNLYEDPAIDLDITGEKVFINDFIDTMEGVLSVSGQVDGTLADPHGNLNLTGDQIDIAIQQIESLRVESIFRENSLFFETVHLTLAPNDTIRANGYVSPDNGYAFEIDTDEISLDRIGVLSGTGITGKTRIAASGKGTFDDPALEGKLFLTDLAIEKSSLDPMEIGFKLEEEVATANVISAFTLDAVYHLDTGDFDFRGDLDDMALDPFLHIADMSKFSGAITARIEAAGNAADPLGAYAHMNIENMVLLHRLNNTQPTELVRIVDLTANLEDRFFSVPRNEITLLETSPVVIAGSGQLDDDFEFMLDGIIPVAAAAPFAPEIQDPEGEIRFSGRVIQKDEQPDLNAEIQFDNMGFTVATLMQTVHQVNGRIRITDKAVAVEDLTGRLDTGSFTARGRIDFDENFAPGQANLNVNARALPIQIPGTLEVTVNSDMTFSGTPEATFLSGQITLLDGLYYRDVEINLLGEVTRRRRGAAVPDEAPDLDIPYLKNLTLDIETGFRRPLMVDNNLALMTLRPEIRITGTISEPGVTGRAEVSQGTVSYQNIEFEITQGLIDFIDPYRIHPEIDIRAVSNVRHWEILLEVSGTPDELEFTLSSNPPEEHADILSLLVLGQTTREMAEGTGPTGPTPQEMLVNILAGRLEEDIRAGTGLDIEVEYGPGNGTDTDQALRVTVGRELSRRMTITYGIERKSGETVQLQTAIYRLLEFLSVSAFQDTAGTFGGEMQFRLEFR